MMLEPKDFLALALVAIALPAGTFAACASWRIREVFFFIMVVAAVIPGPLDINFVSRFWYYRGTTRGFELSVVDLCAFCILVASILFPRKGERRFYWPASLLPLLIYFLWCAISVISAEPKIFGAFELTKVFRSTLVFLAAAYFVRGERELKILVLALAVTVGIEGVMALKQRYMDGIHRVYGSVDHPNSLSMYLCMAGPVLAAAMLSTWSRFMRILAAVTLAVASVTILLTISRAGIPMFLMVVTGAVFFSVSWKLTYRKAIASVFVAAAFAGLLYKSWDNIVARYNEATLEEEQTSKGGRGLYFRLASRIVNDYPLGVGLNNWSYAVSRWYGAKEGHNHRNYDHINEGPEPLAVDSANYAAPAHNLGLLTIGELGIPGLIIFALVWIRWFMMGQGFLWWRSHREATIRLGVGIFFAVGGVWLQSLTEWTYRQTAITLTFHILLGTLASLHFQKKQRVKQQRQMEEAAAATSVVVDCPPPSKGLLEPVRS